MRVDFSMLDKHSPTEKNKMKLNRPLIRRLMKPLPPLPGEDVVADDAALQCEHPHNQVLTLFRARDYITGELFRVAYCYSCNLHITLPTPSDSEIGKYYPAGYYGTGRRFTGIVEWLLNHLHNYRAYQIEQHCRPGKVLDIGCGRGLLLNKLRQRGWEPLGTELSEDAAAYARDHLHLPVLTKPLEELNLPSNEYDLVILWHVLEHVRSPRALLLEIKRILKPGGTLLVAVPNFGSWEARWSRDKWFHLDVPRHLNHFTTRTLGRLLDEVGVPITDMNFFSTEYDFYSFVQTVENKLRLRPNLLYNLLRTRSAKVVHVDGSEDNARLQSLLALLLAVPLTLLSFLYAPLIAFLKRGGTIAAYATRRASADEA
jgi:2-polyprenyl-3-methyl-5-hydroxy-6-metoxy-1,4-benzoquinol methylase